MKRPGFPHFAAFVALLSSAPVAGAIQITGYSSAVNDRYSSGYPAAPVPNANPSFVALGYDLSGVAWASNDSMKGLALISPRHFLATVHWGGAPAVRFQGSNGSIYSYTQQSMEATGYGVVVSGTADLAMGTLAAPVAASTGISSFAVYDGALPLSTPILMYGHGGSTSNSPRLAEAALTGVNVVSPSTSLFATSRTNVRVEGGDSGSPAFVQWVDPNGNNQIAIIGNNVAFSSTDNYLNYIVRDENIASMNTLMADEGYALRFVSNPDTVWDSAASTTYGSGGNWSAGAPSAEDYIGFSTASSDVLNPNLGNQTRTVRGIIFSSGTAGFHLTSGTFELDRGGINNYDTNVQTFDTAFRLTEGQYWDGGNGGLIVNGDVDNLGHLLIVQGAATSELNGRLTGAGGLAKDGSGILLVTGSNTYTGPTFVHQGTFVANNSDGSATGSGDLLVEAGTVAGYGRIEGDAFFSSGSRLTAGAISSGTTPLLDLALQQQNRLTFGGDVHLDGDFAFYLAALSETVGFTQITLDGADADLILGLNSRFVLEAGSFLGVDDPNSGNAFWDIEHQWVLADLTGSGEINNLFANVDLGNWLQGGFTLLTDGGTGNDLVLHYTPVPEPASWLLLAAGAAFVLRLRRTARPRDD